MKALPLRWLRLLLLAVAVTVSVFSHSSPTLADVKPILIGTGGVTGVYFPAGSAVCRFVNKGRKNHSIRCSTESTGGSVDNIEGVRNGTFHLGIVQSDVQGAAYEGGLGFVRTGPFPDLRSLFSLHAEPLHLVARRDSGIRVFDDLKGKRVNIGNPGSGQRETAELILDHVGWTENDFARTTSLKSTEQSSALCKNDIDAVFFTAGIPSSSIKEATTACDTIIVPMTGRWVDSFVAKYPAYAKATIPGGTYRGNDDNVETFGPRATVVASDTLSDEIVYQAVKAVFENLEDFRRLHPAFGMLSADQMTSTGLTAPVHSGAMRYYREAGLR